MGRRTKLTPEVHKKIVSLIVAGNFPEVAAAATGISKYTFYEWIARGRGTDERPKLKKYAVFARDIEKARGEAEARLVARIREHAEKAGNANVQTAMWMLEHGFSKWGREKVGVSVGTTDGDDKPAGVRIEIVHAKDGDV